MGSDAAESKAASSASSNQPSALSQAKQLQQQQDEATTQEPVLLASVRQPMRGARVHALPCSIVHDGPAAVSTFFLPKRVAGGGGQGACLIVKVNDGQRRGTACAPALLRLLTLGGSNDRQGGWADGGGRGGG